MANPQQPELRRSGRAEALAPDAAAGKPGLRSGRGEPEGFGPVPAENVPGHHDDHDQDQPDLDAFAERFGIVPAEASESSETDKSPETGMAAESAGTSHAQTPAGEREPELVLPITHLRQPPPSVAASATVARIGSRLVLGPWIIAGRLAETALVIVDRRYQRALSPRQVHQRDA